MLALWLASVTWLGCATPEPEAPDLDRMRLLAEADLAGGRAERAAEGFRAVLAIAPDDPGSLDGLARAQWELGEAEAAVATLDRLDEVAPGTAGGRGHCPIWRAALDARADDGAIAAAAVRAERLDRAGCDPAPTRSAVARSHAVHGRSEWEAGRLQSALTDYRRSVESPDAPVERYIAGAEILLELGRDDDAVDWLRVALAAHPRDRQLLVLMVTALSGGSSPH